MKNRNKPAMIRWKLNTLMAERRVSIKQLSEATGIHRTTISKLKGTDEYRAVTGEVLNKLCKAFGCPVWELIEYIPENPSDPPDFPPPAWSNPVQYQSSSIRSVLPASNQNSNEKPKGDTSSNIIEVIFPRHSA